MTVAAAATVESGSTTTRSVLMRSLTATKTSSLSESNRQPPTPEGLASARPGGRLALGRSLGRAVRAGAEDLNRVRHVDEPRLARHPLGPRLDLRTLELEGSSAGTAHQVMVMRTGLAPPVDDLAALGSE